LNKAPNSKVEKFSADLNVNLMMSPISDYITIQSDILTPEIVKQHIRAFHIGEAAGKWCME
jgi:hypothetical protein